MYMLCFVLFLRVKKSLNFLLLIGIGNLFSVIETLGGKQLVMQLLSHDDPNVRYEALLAVQKLMVHNWYGALFLKYCLKHYINLHRQNHTLEPYNLIDTLQDSLILFYCLFIILKWLFDPLCLLHDIVGQCRLEYVGFDPRVSVIITHHYG